MPCVSSSLCFSNFDARGNGDILSDIHKPLGAIFKGQVQAGCKVPASSAETFVMCSAVNFRRVHKIAKSDRQLRHVCPSVRFEHLGSNWPEYFDCSENL